MKWQLKAAVMQTCSMLPKGESIYKLIQKRFGRLDANPMSRLPDHVEMAQWIVQSGRPIENQVMLEVGTGHVPIAPIGFYLLGAREVITLDLHPRLDWALTREALRWIARNQSEVEALYRGIATPGLLRDRLDALVRLQDDPKKFFSFARIAYRAPSDAARTGLPAGSIDIHFSFTVFEHIPPTVIAHILMEARRILRPNGAAVHFIDPSDHFQHTDRSITRINFLRYSPGAWQRIAGNAFAYCNRLRASDYRRLIGELHWQIERRDEQVDLESLRALADGFRTHGAFNGYSAQDLSTTRLRVLITPGGV